DHGGWESEPSGVAGVNNRLDLLFTTSFSAYRQPNQGFTGFDNAGDHRLPPIPCPPKRWRYPKVTWTSQICGSATRLRSRSHAVISFLCNSYSPVSMSMAANLSSSPA